MLRLPPFQYVAPSSIAQAVKLLRDYGDRAMLVAGGTDLYPNMKRRQFTPEVLVGLRGLHELAGVRPSADGGLIIGAGTTLTAISRHPQISASYPALASAAAQVSTPQLRNAGTLGGNLCLDTRCNYYNQTYFWRKSIGFCMKKDGDICLVAPGSPRCWAVSSSDCPPALISLGARVRLVGADGERIIRLEELYRDDGIHFLNKAPDEILTHVLLPPAEGLRSGYWKLRRRGSFDFPILGVAIALRQAEDGTISAAHVTLGAVASRPVNASAAAQLLVGQRLTATIIEQVAEAVSRPAKPLDNTDLSISYRKQMVRVYVARALQEMAELASA